MVAAVGSQSISTSGSIGENNSTMRLQCISKSFETQEVFAISFTGYRVPLLSLLFHKNNCSGIIPVLLLVHYYYYNKPTKFGEVATPII